MPDHGFFMFFLRRMVENRIYTSVTLNSFFANKSITSQ